MASRISNITPSRPGASAKYPWDDWTDGHAWRIVRGEDYDVLTASMAAMLRNHALRYGLAVSTAQLRDVDGVEFQFAGEQAA